jgi:hypothetical protein
MPGIVGAVGCEPKLAQILKKEFSRPWTKCDFVDLPGGFLGGHAFAPQRSVHMVNNRGFAIDGELGLYHDARSYVSNSTPELFHLVKDGLVLTERCKGNVALVEQNPSRWCIASEWTGTFPLYYFHGRGQLLFCSRLRPLARAVGVGVDTIGVGESLVKGFTCAGRTLYQNIRRLLPGQSLEYVPSLDKLTISEGSRLWIDQGANEFKDRRAAATIAWSELKRAVQERIRYPGKHGLMLSAGWDSRLLLCAMIELLGAKEAYSYTHGDFKSLELKIVRALRQSVEIEGHEEPLNSAVFAPETLEMAFDRTETIIFPDWVHAGAMAASSGLKSLSCGVYAAVLGGHNGPTATTKGARRIMVGGRSLLEQSIGMTLGSKTKTRELIGFSVKRPSYVCRDFFKNPDDHNQAARADCEYDLQRLKQRGVTNTDKLVEAFISEHRGTQYMEAQPLACRTDLDVNIPYIDRTLLSVACQIPFRFKFHNAVHRTILKDHAAHLLNFPCSATLVPAYMPIPLQEASRVTRRLMERVTWKLYFLTKGRVQPLRFGWPNYEFLRQGNALHALVDSLTADFWDKGVLRNWLVKAAEFSDHRRMTFIWQPLLRVYHTDLMLRD